MIVAIVGELEGLKAKVQAAIDHAKAGVHSLNEDQQAGLRGLVAEIDNEAIRVRESVESILSGAEAKAEAVVDHGEGVLERIVDKIEEKLGLKEAEPSAADLDAHADEQKAAEATSPAPPID